MKLNRVKAEHIPPTTGAWYGKANKSKWKLTKDLVMLNSTVPKGFISDGVSIPFLLFFMAKPTGTLFEPAILHDFLLSELQPGESRKEADLEFYSEMRRYGASFVVSKSLFYTVRIFGKLKVAYHRRFK